VVRLDVGIGFVAKEIVPALDNKEEYGQEDEKENDGSCPVV